MAVYYDTVRHWASVIIVCVRDSNGQVQSCTRSWINTKCWCDDRLKGVILVIVGRADEPMTYLMTMMTRQSLIGLLYTVQRHIFWIQMCTTAVVGLH